MLLVVAFALSIASCSGTDSSAGGTSTKPSDTTVHMNQVQFIGTHNAYKTKPDEQVLSVLREGAKSIPEIAEQGLDPEQINYGHRPLTEQLDSGIRSFELDIWADPTGGRFAHPLAVKMLGLPPPTGVDSPGFDVLHIQEIDYLSTCPTLDACLHEMTAWSDAHPGHLPVTVNLELKQDPLPSPFDVTPIQPFDAAQLDALDAAVRGDLGRRLITPDQVRGSARDLRTAVTAKGSGGGWPTVSDSRGKFLVFLDNGGDVAQLYLAGHPSLRGRPLFASDGFDRPDGAVLKVNEPEDGKKIASLVRKGFLVRTRADADVVHPGIDRTAALASGAQMVHSDFPKGEPQAGTGYEVSFPTPVQARCNPVNTTPATCTPTVVTEPSSS